MEQWERKREKESSLEMMDKLRGATKARCKEMLREREKEWHFANEELFMFWVDSTACCCLLSFGFLSFHFVARWPMSTKNWNKKIFTTSLPTCNKRKLWTCSRNFSFQTHFNFTVGQKINCHNISSLNLRLPESSFKKLQIN